MIGCDFFDDEQPPHGQTEVLPRWASISELSTLLEISRNTISTAVKRAWTNGEPWVKKELTEDGSAQHYLIDTQHDVYQAHQQRWQQNKALQAMLLSETGHPLSSEEDSFPSSATDPHTWRRHKSSEGVLQRWPRFRQWLYAHGVQIFQNLLAEERQENPWEWRWEELHGEGFESDEQAIIAALQSRFDAYEAVIEDQAAFSQVLEQQELQQPRHSWFRRND